MLSCWRVAVSRVSPTTCSGDTRQQQQHCMHVRTDINASLVTPHFGKRSVSQLALSAFMDFMASVWVVFDLYQHFALANSQSNPI
jgi:hypothetical protein